VSLAKGAMPAVVGKFGMLWKKVLLALDGSGFKN
jgi:hypothetical protein